MEKILKLLKHYEEKNSENSLQLVLYSDGSGHIKNGYDDEFFSFNNIQELLVELTS